MFFLSVHSRSTTTLQQYEVTAFPLDQMRIDQSNMNEMMMCHPNRYDLLCGHFNDNEKHVITWASAAMKFSNILCLNATHTIRQYGIILASNAKVKLRVVLIFIEVRCTNELLSIHHRSEFVNQYLVIRAKNSEILNEPFYTKKYYSSCTF